MLQIGINTWNSEIDFWKKNCNFCNFSSRTPRKVLNRKQRTPKNGMGPMLEGLLGSYGVGKVGFSEAKLSIQLVDPDI